MAMTSYADHGFHPQRTWSFAAVFRSLRLRMREKARHERDLAMLSHASDRMLADLGLTRGQVARVVQPGPSFVGYVPLPNGRAGHTLRRR